MTSMSGLERDVTREVGGALSVTSAQTSSSPAPCDIHGPDPMAADFIAALPGWAVAVLSVLVLSATLSLFVYVEEIVFVLRHFASGSRRAATLWILAFFPVFSVSALIAVLVPRASTLIDVVGNAFFATCLYQFGGLIVSYLGGQQATLLLVNGRRHVTTNTPPLCCCCCCLPSIVLDRWACLICRWARLTYRRCYMLLRLTALQFTVVRPMLMFIAAVLWANGTYVSGDVSPRGAYLYITALNLLSTLLAMYGLMLARRAFSAELDASFTLGLKVGVLQFSLAASLLVKLIVGLLATLDLVTCTSYLPSKARAEVISHAVMTVLMALAGLVGRCAFRRLSDAGQPHIQVTTHHKAAPSQSHAIAYSVLSASQLADSGPDQLSSYGLWSDSDPILTQPAPGVV